MFDDNICFASYIHTPKRKRIEKKKLVHYVLSDGVLEMLSVKRHLKHKIHTYEMEIRDGNPFDV